MVNVASEGNLFPSLEIDSQLCAPGTWAGAGRFCPEAAASMRGRRPPHGGAGVYCAAVSWA